MDLCVGDHARQIQTLVYEQSCSYMHAWSKSYVTWGMLNLRQRCLEKFSLPMYNKRLKDKRSS